MTAALRAGQRHLIFILLGGLHKAMAIPAKAGIYVPLNPQEQPGNTSLTATPTPPVIPAKAGNHATPTPRNSPATPA